MNLAVTLGNGITTFTTWTNGITFFMYRLSWSCFPISPEMTLLSGKFPPFSLKEYSKNLYKVTQQQICKVMRLPAMVLDNILMPELLHLRLIENW